MTLKEDKQIKKAATMTAGVTTSKLEDGALINLHGHSATITSTDAEDTTVQYANRARRTFDTHSLNGFFELGTFPAGTSFERPTASGLERAVIAAVTGDCCYRVQINSIADAPRYVTFTYAEFIAWHMETPHKPPTLAELNSKMDEADDEAHLAEALEALDNLVGESNPVEPDPQKRIAQLEADLAAAEINGQSRINALMQENFALKAEINQSINLHNTRLLAAAAEIESLQTKAAIFTPQRKEYCIKYQINESDLNKLALDGWQIQHMQFIGEAGDSQLNVVLVRDLPADQPKARAAVEYTLDIDTAPAMRPPVQQPPMPLPVNQPLIMAEQPGSRALTHNVPRRGDPQRILSPAQLQEQKQRYAGEIEEVFNRGAVRQEALRRHYANQPTAFPQGG